MLWSSHLPLAPSIEQKLNPGKKLCRYPWRDCQIILTFPISYIVLFMVGCLSHGGKLKQCSQPMPKNSTCFQWSCADSVSSWCEILHVASYRCHTLHEERSRRPFCKLPWTDTRFCVLRAFYRLSETIHMPYPHVDKIVTNRKKIFVQSQTRMDFYKNKALVTTLSLCNIYTTVKALCIVQTT
jgi:hypothetical protein